MGGRGGLGGGGGGGFDRNRNVGALQSDYERWEMEFSPREPPAFPDEERGGKIVSACVESVS